ncbi:hypothetical protein DB35_09435 [Streptomyces abyssalis]|uniref:DUF3995 domain-containing protein n=1 Tax=Streptomyces abyssalis TaxID=933944 RepID=A0A1E7JRX9_9ACTN|nr:hypothetical protein AN215_03380 [Streptomyces abyssalis]OEU94268.1 hypothetical protein DB35_09435 [Streptomyces abyssalis]
MLLKVKSWQWGYAACSWAVVFAGTHFYWALGGSAGLKVSAGEQLATGRPLWFVLTGLWGVGALCLVGAWLGWLLARSRPRGAALRIVEYLGWVLGFVLLARGIAVEFLLLTNVTDLDGVTADQRFWTHVLWNPWFFAGGLAFGLAARDARRRSRSSAPQAGRSLHTVNSR